MAISPAVRSLIIREAREHSVSADLALALIQQESAGNVYAVSKVGAMGLGQLMPLTARDLGVSDPFDAAQNVRGSMKYLGKLIKDHGERLGVAGYNAGPHRILQYKDVPPFKETQEYVKKIETRMGRAYR